MSREDKEENKQATSDADTPNVANEDKDVASGNAYDDAMADQGEPTQGQTVDDNTEIASSKLGVHTAVEIDVPAPAFLEADGVQESLQANIDERFASMQNQIDAVKSALDSFKVHIENINSRISIFETEQTIVENATLSNDQLLTNALNKFI